MNFLPPGKYFADGNFALTEGAIHAGCRFFAGYPITPSSEVLERMSIRLPEVGGHFIEMEDEIASMAAIIGASNGGSKSMTATSGPGFSLMQENIGLGVITETPTVVLDEMRGGPSTGIPTRVGQGDVMQTRWGSHGDLAPITFAPNSVQESFDLEIEAFNAAETYRQPVIVASDQVIGHLTEILEVKNMEDYHIVQRETRKIRNGNEGVYDYSRDFIPMFEAGTGFRGNVDSLTHDERGYPSNESSVEKEMLEHLLNKVRKNEDKIVKYEEFLVEDSKLVVVAYGITSRSVKQAVKEARKEGLKVGMFRPITLWPFPEKRIRQLAEQSKEFIVPEINYGQYSHSVREYSQTEIKEMHFPPGAVPDYRVILKEIERCLR
jgi:2-oxoglutarate ferredoxin oxidoreductase subunit alpha